MDDTSQTSEQAESAGQAAPDGGQAQGPQAPTIPHVEKPTDLEGVSAIGAELAKMRGEMAAFREAMAKGVPSIARALPVVETEAERAARRVAEIAQYSHYCPGCGALYNYMRECTGRGEAPHQPIEVVSTDELKSGDPSQHTAAPNTDRLVAA